MMSEPTPETPKKDPSLLQAVASAAAALFGVQSSKNRERDFNANSPGRFILMGALMTCVFVTCVLFAVRCTMQQAGLAGD